jgi:hypothetical protein
VVLQWTEEGRQRKRCENEVQVDLNIMGIKKTENGQRLSVMVEDCVESQCPQRI